jgi:hypothetical protein
MVTSALAGEGAPPPDPFLLTAFGASDNFAGEGYKTTTGLTIRSPVINPAIKTLVLIVAGQSIWANTNPTAFVPTNASVVDNFNIYDGAIYSIAGPLLGTTLDRIDSGVGAPGFGNMSSRVADTLVTNGNFNRVILVPIAIGSTSVADWATGQLSNRFQVAMLRLASRGIVPGLTGVTFACIYGQGEQDNVIGTSQSAWEASFATLKSNILATGFNGRIFVPVETFDGGVTSAAVAAAQAAVVDNVAVFSGGNFDTLTATADRQSSGAGPHMTDAGAEAAAALTITAMNASGAPF